MSEPLLFSYNVQSLFVGGNAPYSANFESVVATNIQGVQAAAVTIAYPRAGVFGWDGGGDQVLVDRPQAELSFSYCFTSGLNENRLGFPITPNGSISALSNLNVERNFYLLFNQGHQDLIGYSGFDNKVMAFGNGLLTQYSLNASVGQPTVVNVNIGALNLLIQPSGSGQILPVVNKQAGTAVTGRYVLPFAEQTIQNYFESSPSAIDLTFDTGCAIGAFLSGQNSCPIQTFGFSIEVPRQQVKDLGWAYPNERPAQWPMNISIHADAYLNGIQVDALNRFNCPDSGLNFGIRFKNGCNLDTDNFTFQFNGTKLDGQSFSSQVGAYTRASFNWSLKINDVNRLTGPNFFMSQTGIAYSSIIFPEVDYVSGSSPLTFNLGALCYLSILSGPAMLEDNQIHVSDEAGTVVVRAITTDFADTQDLTVIVV